MRSSTDRGEWSKSCGSIPLSDEKQYEADMLEISALMDAEFGTPEAARLDLLVERVYQYQEKHYPIGRKNEQDRPRS